MIFIVHEFVDIMNKLLTTCISNFLHIDCNSKNVSINQMCKDLSKITCIFHDITCISINMYWYVLLSYCYRYMFTLRSHPFHHFPHAREHKAADQPWRLRMGKAPGLLRTTFPRVQNHIIWVIELNCQVSPELLKKPKQCPQQSGI